MTGADRELHAALGIDAALLREARVRRVTDIEARELLSVNGKPGTFAGIEYPYLDPETGRPVTCRIRLDAPTSDGKYRSSYGDRRHLYFAPGAAALLDDVSVPVVIVEAEKSTLALTAAGRRADRHILPIGLGGCWGWRGRIGKTDSANGTRVDEHGPLPDFLRIAWQSREAIILFDARPNPSVNAARHQLARQFRQWGATVKHAHLPDDDGRVNGPDDLIRWQGDAALWTVIDRAVSEDFIRNKSDAIAPNALDNIRIALSKLHVPIIYDAFRREVWMHGRPADDVALDRLWLAIDDTFHFRPNKDTLHTVILGEAHAAPVHPVRRYLDALTWDQSPRLASWLATYGGAEDSPYVQAVSSLVLIAAARRVRQPGCKFDELLILESAQGTLKSSALRALCPDESWFSDDLPLGVDSKIVIERTAGKWIIEASELHGNRGRESEQLKAFLSRQTDGPVRLAYGRLPTTVPRQFIIIGTTNSRLAYLKDSTGGRRFWPVTVKRFDVAALERDRDQIWAEAAALEAAGASIRLDPELWVEASRQQEERRAVDPWESILEPLLEGDGVVTVDYVDVDDIWKALKLEANSRDNRAADRVAAIFQQYGFTKKKRIRVDGKPRLCWLKEGVCQ